MQTLTEVEIEELRKQLVAEKKRRVAAEDALNFYGNPLNYGHHRPVYEKETVQNVLQGDNETAANTKETKIAGARARNHFKVFADL